MKRHEAFPSKWLKTEDLQGKPRVVTIEAVGIEDIGDDGDRKPVMSFQGMEKGFVLNSTNFDTIAEAYGEETDDWHGHKIELYPTTTDFKGKRTPCIRIRTAPAKPAPRKPAATFESENPADGMEDPFR